MTPVRQSPGARRFGALGFALVLLSACAIETTADKMTLAPGAVQPLAHGAKGEHAFRLGNITGGGSTEAIGLSNISSEQLRKALEASLGNLNYLGDPATARYVVSVDILNLDRPVAAMDPALLFVPVDLTVTATLRYTVAPTGGGKPIFSDVVATTGTGSGWTPAERVRKANEDAMRLNIAEFLNRVAFALP